MITVAGVRFRTAGKIYFFDPAGLPIHKGDHVIVETARGIEFGTVVGELKEVEEDKVISPLKPVLRIANQRDEEQEAANKQKEKVLSQLQKWYPQVNAFEAQLRPYDEQLKLLRQNEIILRHNETHAQWALHDQRLENQSLADELQEYRDFIDSIPQEILEELKARYEMSEQLQQQQQEM